MLPIVLSQGPPPLTQDAADAALDAIDFIAAAVRGYDAIEVTSVVRPIWRRHLAYWYPQLPPPTRQWYAAAQVLLSVMHARWPLLDPWQRQLQLQQWAMELPFMLAMVDPVLAEAEAIEMEAAQHEQLASWRQQGQQGWAEYTRTEAAQTPAQWSASTANFENFSTAMTNATLNLMNAMSRR